MRNMSLGITAFVVSVGMISVGAQGRSFSGTWVIDGDKTMAANQASGQTEGRVVARGVGGGGGGSATGGVVTAGGGGGTGGAAVARSGRVIAGEGASASGTGGVAVGGVMTAGAGGARGTRAGVAVSSDTVITMDATTFTIDQGGFQTSYPLNGNETTIQTRGGQAAKARASWKGDMLMIEQTLDTPDGPVTSTTSWFLEGDSLVRLTRTRTYYKRK